ncbi:zinc-ribbon and DUF3426 domain-containing protein [Simiduia aestuariiviva]|uniref:Putative Zn finger-like uncharacterized protein n=1 Tax=Simiduia aestuariiviva TaxID=1510459 RepID=A0A839UIE7_9GAMM|nr:zinc-ribbon and DUF3426 domain-containing protein [Simiduia aestuariiviva]MBB3167293.1 putative Zn finger-like uncharacterized protein [Simiduia aestuariiviva]
MTQFVTRCPKCSTSFRITQAQMDRAKGAVRCGSCLQIFRAADHLVNAPAKPGASSAAKPAAQPTAKAAAKATAPKPAAAAKSTAKAKAAPKPAAQSVKPSTPKPAQAAAPANQPKKEGGQGLKFNQQAIDEEADWDDDQLIHDDLFDEEEKDRTGELSDSFFDIYEPRKASQPEKSIFDREIKPIHDDDEDTERPDESWALSILEEVEDETREEAKKAPAAADKEQYSRATTGTFTALSDADLEAAIGDNFNITGEQPAYDEEGFDSAPYDHEPEPESKKGPVFKLAEGDERQEPLFTEMEEVDDEPGMRAYDPERRAALRAIEPEPLEFGFQVEKSDLPKRLMWGGLTACALLAFIVQLAMINIDQWGRAQATRAYYQQLCPLLGCNLPSLSDPSQVQASNLVVRSHPRMADALQIDAVLLNKARFDQPFPLLEIQFSDLQGKLVAARKFTPKEYLGGELAGQTQMPSNQPVHIALEILDPGPEAVNYTARIAH